MPELNINARLANLCRKNYELVEAINRRQVPFAGSSTGILRININDFAKIKQDFGYTTPKAELARAVACDVLTEWEAAIRKETNRNEKA